MTLQPDYRLPDRRLLKLQRRLAALKEEYLSGDTDDERRNAEFLSREIDLALAFAAIGARPSYPPGYLSSHQRKER